MRAIDEQSQPPDRSLEYAAVGDRCGPRQGFGGTNNLVICGRSKPVVGADGPDNRATVGAVAGQAGYRVWTYRGMTNLSGLSPHWRCGFEVEVVFGALGDPRLETELRRDGPMDVASASYCRAVAKRLSEYSGHDWAAPIKAKSKCGFYVVPEYDLDPICFPEDAMAGVELITPPMTIPDAENLRDVLRGFIDDLGSSVNFGDSDLNANMGWHINVDAGERRSLAIENFLFLADEIPTLLENDRHSSEYTAIQRHAFGVPLLRQMMTEASSNSPHGQIGNLARHHSGRGKRFAANFAKLEHGYVELRHFGIRDFLGFESLQDLLLPLLSAFEADHESLHKAQDRMVAMFRILSDWFKNIRPNLGLTWKETTIPVSGSFGEIQYQNEPVARTMWGGTMDITVLDSSGADLVTIRNQQFPDTFSAIAILALDLAEMKSRGLHTAKLQNKMFAKEVESLSKRLVAEGLFKPTAIAVGQWWQ